MSARIEKMLSGRGFAHGVFWNILGRAFPIIVAAAATPVLLGQLGVERWGLFTLTLSVVGSFGILDFGVSAALTRVLAERIGTEGERDAPGLIATALVLLGVTGIVGSAAAFAWVPWFVDAALHVPDSLRGEAILAFRALAATGPLILINAALWGVLAAYQHFRAANVIGITLGSMYYLAPMPLLWLHDSLVVAVLALALVRLTQTVAYVVLIFRLIPNLSGDARVRPALLRILVRIGAWVTVSNTLAPLMTYADRFIVGATVSLAAVSHYVTPVDFIWRLTLVPIAIATTLFPAVVISNRVQPERMRALLRLGSLGVIVSVLPACVVLVGLARELMTLWLGAPFATESYVVLTIAGIGVFFSCLAALPGTMVDAIGRPDIGAYFLIVQAILFPPAIFVMASTFGIKGAAAMWSTRAIVNCAGRYHACGWLIPSVRPAVRRVLALSAIAAAGLAVCAVTGPLPIRSAAMLTVAVGVPLLAAWFLLEASEMERLKHFAAIGIGRLSRTGRSADRDTAAVHQPLQP